MFFNVIKYVFVLFLCDWFLKDYIVLFEVLESYNGYYDLKNVVGFLVYCNSYDNLKYFEKIV